jgi:hypothetical protein
MVDFSGTLFFLVFLFFVSIFPMSILFQIVNSLVLISSSGINHKVKKGNREEEDRKKC